MSVFVLILFTLIIMYENPSLIVQFISHSTYKHDKLHTLVKWAGL